MTIKEHCKNYFNSNPRTSLTIYDWKEWFGKRLKNIKDMEIIQTKIDFLKSKGWKPLLSHDNWVDTNKIYNLPDFKGLPLEEAYMLVKTNEIMYENVKVALKNVIVNYNGEKFIGEIVEVIRQYTMDGVLIEQYMIKSTNEIYICYEHQIKNMDINDMSYN